jgi:hypothetical protein
VGLCTGGPRCQYNMKGGPPVRVSICSVMPCPLSSLVGRDHTGCGALVVTQNLCSEEWTGQSTSFDSKYFFANMNVFRHILVIDISVFAKSNMGWRE